MGNIKKFNQENKMSTDQVQTCPFSKIPYGFVGGTALINVWFMYAAWTDMSLLAGVFSLGTWTVAFHLAGVMVCRAMGAGVDAKAADCPMAFNVSKQTYIESYEFLNHLVNWVRSVLYVKKPFNTAMALVFCYVNSVFFNYVGNCVSCWLILNAVHLSMATGNFSFRAVWTFIDATGDFVTGILSAIPSYKKLAQN